MSAVVLSYFFVLAAADASVSPAAVSAASSRGAFVRVVPSFLAYRLLQCC